MIKLCNTTPQSIKSSDMKTLSIIIGLLILVIQQGLAQGSTHWTGSNVRINTKDTLRGNNFMAGQLVEMMGVVDDDLFSASRQLILEGTVNDDAFLAGQVVSVRGRVGDMLVVAGETVIIDAAVGGDLFATGRKIQITENARITGNVAIAGETVIFEGGSINGWLRAAGGNLTINGTVNEFVELYTNEVTFGSRYDARYSTSITSTEQIHRENLGVMPENLNLFIEEPDVWGVVLFQLWFFLSLLITGLILIRIFQQSAIDMYKFATEHIWKNTGIGLIAFIIIPIVIIGLFILFLTIPLGVLLSLTYGLALFVSYLLVAMTLGVMSILYFKDEPTISTYYWGLVLGMIIVAILTNLPFIGWLFNVFFILFGLGSVVYYFWMISRSGKEISRAET